MIVVDAVNLRFVLATQRRGQVCAQIEQARRMGWFSHDIGFGKRIKNRVADKPPQHRKIRAHAVKQSGHVAARVNTEAFARRETALLSNDFFNKQTMAFRRGL